MSNLSNKLHFLDGTDGGTNQPKIYKKRDFKRNPLSQGSGNEKKNLSSHPRLEALYCFPKSISWINNSWPGVF